MNRSFLLLLGLALVLGSTTALAQNRIAHTAPIRVAEGASFTQPVLYRVPASAVRVVNPTAVDLHDVTWTGSSERGSVLDSIAYYDFGLSPDYTYYTTLEEYDPLATPDNDLIEASLRFTPGYGNTLGGIAGQVTAYGFTMYGFEIPANGGGPTDGGTLLVIFSKFETGEPFLGYDRPGADLVLAVTLDPSDPDWPCTVNDCALQLELDLSSFNLFFENTEEYIVGLEWVDTGDDQVGLPGTVLRYLLDNGREDIQPPAEPGYYDHTYPRSGLIFNYVGDVTNPPGLYFSDWCYEDPPGSGTFNGCNNYWYYSRYDAGAAPVIGIDTNPTCGQTSDNCDFAPDELLVYQVCFSHTGTTNAAVKVKVTLNGPDPVVDRLLFNRNLMFRPNFNRCVNFRAQIRSNDPDGYYQVLAEISTQDETVVHDYDVFYYTKTTPAALAGQVAERAAAPLEGPAALSRTASPSAPATDVVVEGWLEEASATTAPGAVVLSATPNPFAMRTTLRYTVDEATPVRLAVYDLLGREVAVLVDGHVEAGQHEALFDASALAAGVYVYRLRAGDQVQTGRLTLTR